MMSQPLPDMVTESKAAVTDVGVRTTSTRHFTVARFHTYRVGEAEVVHHQVEERHVLELAARNWTGSGPPPPHYGVTVALLPRSTDRVRRRKEAIIQVEPFEAMVLHLLCQEVLRSLGTEAERSRGLSEQAIHRDRGTGRCSSRLKQGP